MTISVFSQESYPRKIIIDGDTIVALTPYQLIQINNKLFDRKILLRNDSISQVSLALCYQAVNSCYEERLLCDSAQDSSEKEKIILREELDLYKQGNDELFKENIKLNNQVGFYKITTGFAVAFLLIKIFIR